MDLRLFFTALTGDTVALMSGAGSVVLLILGLTVFFNKPLPRGIVLLVAAACFFLASARIWTAEYRARIAAEKKLDDLTKPKLVGVIDQWFAGDSSEAGGFPVFVVVSIKNDGAPSIAQGFRMRIKADAYDVTVGPTFIPKGFRVRDKDHKLIADFDQAEKWQDKAEIPVTQGVKLRGWLLFVFKGVSSKQVQNATDRIREIHFRDINDQPYTVTDKTLDTPGMYFYPGAGTPFKSK
jgi:hypothetical protein